MKFKFKANSVYNRWLVWCSMDGSNFSASVRNLTAKFKQSEMFFGCGPCRGNYSSLKVMLFP